jgi:hypothetical protein
MTLYNDTVWWSNLQRFLSLTLVVFCFQHQAKD